MYINFSFKKRIPKYRKDNLLWSALIYKFVFFILFTHNSLYAQKTIVSEPAKSPFKIEHFGILDASEDHYDMAIAGSDEEELCKILKGFDKEREFKIKLSGIKTEIYKGSLYTGVDSTVQRFYFNAYETIPPNANTKLELFLSQNGKEKKVDEMIVNIPATSGNGKRCP
jgi:hypothetical protein